MEVSGSMVESMVAELLLWGNSVWGRRLGRGFVEREGVTEADGDGA
jgi:hypothetical protein